MKALSDRSMHQVLIACEAGDRSLGAVEAGEAIADLTVLRNQG